MKISRTSASMSIGYLSKLLVALSLVLPATAGGSTPVIYSTDLYHPHDDPDDHFDLATLFALPELDVKGIIIDMANIHGAQGHRNPIKQPGIVALKQMAHLTGRQVPYATGLDQPLRTTNDRALQQSADAQSGVHMILSTLKASPEKVSLFTVGSLRDVAAAYNRDPELMRSKIRAIYINAGTGPQGYQEEWNVRLDPLAYQRVLLSELPLRWYPCFGRDSYFTYFRVDQSEILGNVTPSLRAYFDYALSRSHANPIAYLSRSCPPPSGPRNMWCTASFIDLAGRKIYRTARGFEALAAPPQADSQPVECYTMVPVKLQEGTSPHAVAAPAGKGVECRFVGNDKDLVGKTRMTPDGTPDCRVEITGLSPAMKIRSAKLTGPRAGVWLYPLDPQRWPLSFRWHDDQLLVAFTYWAPDLHQLDIVFEDGSKKSFRFTVPPQNSPLFEASFDPSSANVFVIRKREPEYTQVMSSCLKNLLDSFSPVAGAGRSRDK